MHKHPDKVQTFSLSFGQAHVFYPQADNDHCTACLLLDIDPVGLVRNRRGPSGKSTFAREHFGRFEVVSSDFCRGVVSNDENDQTVSKEAFDLLHSILHHRLRLGRLTVVDATNVRPEDRKQFVRIAREHHVLPVAIVFDIPEQICHQRNEARDDRNFGSHVIRGQRSAMKRYLRGLKREGFRHVFTFCNVEEVEGASIARQPLWNDKRSEHGPFDIIGDIHGCHAELVELLEKLDYRVERTEGGSDGLPYQVTPPSGRKAVFLGDLVDRGRGIVDTLKLVMAMCRAGVAHCVPGNHDIKLTVGKNAFTKAHKPNLLHTACVKTVPWAAIRSMFGVKK